jgi:NADH dehydrogenase
LYPPLAQIAVREAKYLSKLIPKHFIANFNNHVISGNLAKLVKEFSMSAYIKTLRSWGRDIMNISLYGDDLFSHLYWLT